MLQLEAHMRVNPNVALNETTTYNHLLKTVILKASLNSDTCENRTMITMTQYVQVRVLSFSFFCWSLIIPVDESQNDPLHLRVFLELKTINTMKGLKIIHNIWVWA